MKGVVFTEFLEMVETTFGYEVTDAIITKANLPSKGVYTSVGTYDHHEMICLLTELNQITAIPVPDLLRQYGHYLFKRFAVLFPSFFENAHSAFDFLESIHNYIHKEVLKLYPDAELPNFETFRRAKTILEMTYHSDRMMGHFAHGLILGCLDYFKESATVTIENLNDKGSVILFTIIRQNE